MVVRIKDIARDLGVSSMTVSKALRNQFDISEETRKRVVKRAEELGYQPNLVARGLVTRRTYMIGIVIPDLMHSFFAEVIKGAAKRIKSHGYHVVIVESEGDADSEMAQIETLLALNIDGLIIASAQSDGRRLRRTLGEKRDSLRSGRPDAFRPESALRWRGRCGNWRHGDMASDRTGLPADRSHSGPGRFPTPRAASGAIAARWPSTIWKSCLDTSSPDSTRTPQGTKPWCNSRPQHPSRWRFLLRRSGGIRRHHRDRRGGLEGAERYRGDRRRQCSLLQPPACSTFDG